MSSDSAMDVMDQATKMDELTKSPEVDGMESKITGTGGDATLDGDVDLNENMDEQTRLDLLAFSKDQDELERDIGRQADQLLTEQADERDQKRLDKTKTLKDRLEAQVVKIDQRLELPGSSTTKNPLRSEKTNLQAQIASLKTELDQIRARMTERREKADEETEAAITDGRLPNESRRDYLIRTGKITPFSKMAQAPPASANLADIMLAAEHEGDGVDDDEEAILAAGPVSHTNLKKPGFAADYSSDSSTYHPSGRKSRKRKRQPLETIDDSDASLKVAESGEDFKPDDSSPAIASGSDFESDSGNEFSSQPKSKSQSRMKRARTTEDEDEEQDDLTGVDDGNERLYKARLESWCRRRQEARRKARSRNADSEIREGVDAEDTPEWLLPHPTVPDTALDSEIGVPGDIFPSLFDYQKTGVRWLSELYSQQVGGIVGDEMGLGKTIQAISFIAGLHHSNKLTKPIIVICPATVMRQWVNEFHRWWPPLRVSILHTSGSGMINTKREAQIEHDLEFEEYANGARGKSKSYKSAQRIVDRVTRDGHILVTTYSGLQTYADLLLQQDWQYAVLDEGHKIRNPNTAITLYTKELRTPNRIILSGTPMQNNLTELWSLFDFVYPMRLGTLVTFRQQFEYPIKQGGYANASNLQVETAMHCAEMLKDTISPYLLQRFKIDVASDLPKKTERVLFCKLTRLQRKEYESFLGSEEMKSIINGKRQPLYGVDILRKLCNHPDLMDHKRLSIKPNYNYGEATKSGKMQVVKALLELWHKDGHKTLLFAQHRIMLDILERFMKSLPGFRYRRMDGNTSIKDRQTLVDEFNRDPNLHVFLLTTKVGGLGVNLTGADRVIIYDPDWNPSTDVQARERAWRLGQKKEVEIYRLMTAGTIEEKIYHRQIFKQFLTNKILRDPKQRQTFQLSDLHDLFTLADASDGTETGSIFKGTEVKIKDRDSSPISTRVRNDTRPPAPNRVRNLPIVRQEDYAAPVTADTAMENNTDTNKPDRLLSVIFSRSDIHSAHEHDAILASNGPKVLGPDPEHITREAKKAAHRAALELKRAGEIARQTPAGVPTWTGTFGIGGHPDEVRRGGPSGRGGLSGRGGRGGGPSSSSVLATLVARREVGGSNSETSRASTPSAYPPRGKDFMAMIRDFLKAHGGSCYTQNLIDHFNRYCGTEQRTAEFKAMLKKIANLETTGPQGRGRSKWVLKNEYKN
jgi:DNA excision repair protein ERCC-6